MSKPASADMPPQVVARVADRFKALAEPSRLQLLQALRDGDASVSELVDRTGLSQANVSKHLAVLLAAGFVSRRRNGLFVHYQLADRDVLRLCEIMCDRLGKELRLRRQEVGTALGGRKDGRTERRKDLHTAKRR